MLLKAVTAVAFIGLPGAMTFLHAGGVVFTAPAVAQNFEGDAGRGKEIFERRCTGCHALDANREGPRLRGVYGRKAGSVEGFEYTKGLSESGITWDEKLLDRWLTNPEAMAPGTEMNFHVESSRERADVIRYLQIVSKTP
ncbi:MAG TPA: c-type cytochrome [Acidobacteriaceae bacterium]